MEWSSYLLGVVSGLSVSGLVGLKTYVMQRLAARKVEAALGDDLSLRLLRERTEDLEYELALVPELPCDDTDYAAMDKIDEWANHVSTELSGLMHSITNFPYRPIPDPALVGRIELMEELTATALSDALGPGAGGPSDYSYLYSARSSVQRALTEARFVLSCYEPALRNKLQQR